MKRCAHCNSKKIKSVDLEENAKFHDTKLWFAVPAWVCTKCKKLTSDARYMIMQHVASEWYHDYPKAPKDTMH